MQGVVVRGGGSTDALFIDANNILKCSFHVRSQTELQEKHV